MSCPECKSTNIKQIGTEAGDPYYKCVACGWQGVTTHFSDAKKSIVDFHAGIDYEKIRAIIREEIVRGIEGVSKSVVNVMDPKQLLSKYFVRIMFQSVKVSDNGFEYVKPQHIIEVPVEKMDKDGNPVFGMPKIIQ